MQPNTTEPTTDEKRFQVWFVPTERGKRAFGWKEGVYRGTLMTAEDANLEAYIANLEEPAPDAREFGSYKVREAVPDDPLAGFRDWNVSDSNSKPICQRHTTFQAG